MVEPTPKVSIIIPVYNVEKYLNMCLKTVTCQTLQDIEIIVVNDSTPDNSEKIINNYIAKDDRIIYIKHSSNKGHGGALNSGLRKVRGEYTWMVDSDDFIDKPFLFTVNLPLHIARHPWIKSFIDQQHFFVDCSPEKTRAEVRRCFEAAGSGGGYILCPSDHFFDADPALLHAFVDEAQRCAY